MQEIKFGTFRERLSTRSTRQELYCTQLNRAQEGGRETKFQLELSYAMRLWLERGADATGMSTDRVLNGAVAIGGRRALAMCWKLDTGLKAGNDGAVARALVPFSSRTAVGVMAGPIPFRPEGANSGLCQHLRSSYNIYPDALVRDGIRVLSRASEQDMGVEPQLLVGGSSSGLLRRLHMGGMTPESYTIPANLQAMGPLQNR